MSPKSPASAMDRRGFTLIEVMVAVTILVVVLTLSLSLLWTMRTFAERQQLTAQPRQTARRAVEYLSYLVRGAGDFNQSTYTLIAWAADAVNPTTTVYRQTCYNNLSTAAPNAARTETLYDTFGRRENFATTNFGDIGTDLISVIMPRNNTLLIIARWPGRQNNPNQGGQAAAAQWFHYDRGCPDNAACEANFEREVQWDHTTRTTPVYQVWDNFGNWGWYQITGPGPHLDCFCNQYPTEIHVVASPGRSDHLNPPAGQPQLNCDFPGNPCSLQFLNFFSIRVRNRTLQMKPELFDPDTDNPGAEFIPILENVEDFQIAYLYDDGNIYNNGTTPLPTNPASAQVPSVCQTFNPDTSTCAAYQGGTEAYTADHLIGARITVVARSPKPMPNLYTNRYSRPSAEDRAAGGADRYFHYRLTSTIMFRNRMRGQ